MTFSRMPMPHVSARRVGTAIFLLFVFLAAGIFLSAQAYGKPGATGKGQAKPRIDVRPLRDNKVPMRDGIYLATDVALPVTKGPFPTILARLPYGKKKPAMLLPLAHILAQRGFVFVIQDCRGKFKSQGTFRPFEQEVADGADTIKWIKQQPWSDGRVIPVGFSYLGYTAWAAAIGAGGAQGVVPITTTPNPYDMVYSDGILNYMMALDWAISIEGTSVNPTGNIDWYRPILTALENVDDLVSKDISLYNTWVAHPTPDNYWKRIDLSKRIRKINAPSLLVGGWYDPFCKHTLETFTSLRKNGVGKSKMAYLMIGPWSHSLTRKVGPVDFGNQAGFSTVVQAMAAFINQISGKEGAEKLPRISLFTMGENRWRAEKEWPLKRTVYKKYYLHSQAGANTIKGDGKLSASVPETQEPDRFTFNPRHPVPSVGGSLYPASFAGPRDQRAVLLRKDVLVYTSEPMTVPTEVTGPISVTLYASSSAKDTDFTATLSAVSADGRSLNLQDGIVRASYRNGLGKSSAIQPGAVVKYTLDLGATSYLFFPGQKIRVSISSSSFPQFAVNHNTGVDPARDARFLEAEQAVFHSAKYPSHITLPIIPRD
jgi:uncharacterized protein